MCGIIAYTGSREAKPILLDGLKTLEYRGYDSAGFYIPGSDIEKSVGEIKNLEDKVAGKSEAFAGHSGIAHTRWATHGEPNLENAHPHKDASGEIYLVHNGIIENYQELKCKLQESGISFYSATDSEVLANLIARKYQGDLVKAVKDALKEVNGAYGMAVMHKDDPDTIVVARMGSPVVLGVGEGEHFISSDTSALISHTKRVVYLEDGDVAVVKPESYQIQNQIGENNQRQEELINWDREDIQKGGYDHFMEKEIMEGPSVIRDTLRGRLGKDYVKLGGLESVLKELKNIDRLTISACGSAYLAGLTGKHLLEEHTGLPVDCILASEYRFHSHHLKGNEALLVLSQSGETADTLKALREAKKNHLLTLGIVNVVGSSISRETTAGVYNHIGPEIAVASTKVFISELVVMVLFTLLLRQETKLDESESREIIQALRDLPEQIEKLLKTKDDISNIAKKYAAYQNAMFLGRHTHVPIAYEGALKLKEVSYIHAEAYPAGELKHGPIAMLDENFPVIALIPKDDTYERMSSSLEEVKARKAPVLAIANDGDDRVAKLADQVIYIPKAHKTTQPALSAIALHLFSYYVGVHKGLNVDRPRNLAKSVTVE